MGYLLASLTEQQVNNSSLNEIKGYFCHLKFRLIGPGRKGSSVARVLLSRYSATSLG